MEAELSELLVKQDDTVFQEGTLYYISPDQMAALFNTGDHLIINKDRMKIDIGMFHGKFRLNRNKTMRKISQIFLYGLEGRCQDLAKENNYLLQQTKEEEQYKITMSCRKKNLLGIGYRQVICYYNTENLIIEKIILIDYNNNVDTYTIAHVKCNVIVDESKFSY